MCSVCPPSELSMGEANAMANYYKNSSIYPPPLLTWEALSSPAEPFLATTFL